MVEPSPNPYAPIESHDEGMGSEQQAANSSSAVHAVFDMLRGASTAFATFIGLCTAIGASIIWETVLTLFAVTLGFLLLGHPLEASLTGRRWNSVRGLRGYFWGVALALTLYLIGVLVCVVLGMPANFLRGM